MIKSIIFDFSRTLYDPETGDFYSGAIDLLDKLKSQGYKLGLVTRTPQLGERESQLKELGLDKYFQAVDIFTKDSTKNFNKIFTRLNIQPEESVVIGDRISSEIIEGNRAGAVTVWIRQGKFAMDEPGEKIEQPDYTIYNLSELLDILEDYAAQTT